MAFFEAIEIAGEIASTVNEVRELEQFIEAPLRRRLEDMGTLPHLFDDIRPMESSMARPNVGAQVEDIDTGASKGDDWLQGHESDRNMVPMGQVYNLSSAAEASKDWQDHAENVSTQVTGTDLAGLAAAGLDAYYGITKQESGSTTDAPTPHKAIQWVHDKAQKNGVHDYMLNRVHDAQQIRDFELEHLEHAKIYGLRDILTPKQQVNNPRTSNTNVNYEERHRDILTPHEPDRTDLNGHNRTDDGEPISRAQMTQPDHVDTTTNPTAYVHHTGYANVAYGNGDVTFHRSTLRS